VRRGGRRETKETVVKAKPHVRESLPFLFPLFLGFVMFLAVWGAALVAQVAVLTLVLLASLVFAWWMVPAQLHWTRKLLTHPGTQLLQEFFLWWFLWVFLRPTGVVSKGVLMLGHLGIRLFLVNEYYRLRGLKFWRHLPAWTKE
jgi:hypothetical protein